MTNDGVNGYSWDADGKPVNIAGASLTYDAFDRMVEQNRNGSYTQIVYGPYGRKLALMNGQTLTKGSISLPAGAKAVYTAETTLVYFRHPDWLGSSRFASTASQGMHYDGAYAPFGESYAEAGTVDRSFTGQNQDTVASGSYPLYDFQMREYHPNWGRWASPDPGGLAAADPSDPQTWNRYAYLRGDPLGITDPLGLQGDCGDDPTCLEYNAPPGPADCTGKSGDRRDVFWYCLDRGSISSGGGGGGSAPCDAARVDSLLVFKRVFSFEGAGIFSL